MSNWDGEQQRIEGMDEALEMMQDLSGKRQCSAYDTCKELYLAGYRKTGDPCKKKWNGEGMPPVGAVCEIECGFDEYEECTILAHHKSRAVFVLNDRLHYSAASAECFRPIRSAEEVVVEAMREAVNSDNGKPSRRQVCRDIYAAIRDGKIPGVKLEE